MRMDNPESLVTLAHKTQNNDKQNGKNTTQKTMNKNDRHGHEHGHGPLQNRGL